MTVHVNADRRRPAAAIAARRRQKAQRLVAELVARLGELDDAWLGALTAAAMAEAADRELEVEHLFVV